MEELARRLIPVSTSCQGLYSIVFVRLLLYFRLASVLRDQWPFG